MLVSEDELNEKINNSYPPEDAMSFLLNSGSDEVQWCFSQVKGALDDDVTEGTGPLIL